jgi:hypothetical protein
MRRRIARADIGAERKEAIKVHRLSPQRFEATWLTDSYARQCAILLQTGPKSSCEELMARTNQDKYSTNCTKARVSMRAIIATINQRKDLVIIPACIVNNACHPCPNVPENAAKIMQYTITRYRAHYLLQYALVFSSPPILPSQPIDKLNRHNPLTPKLNTLTGCKTTILPRLLNPNIYNPYLRSQQLHTILRSGSTY